MKSNRKSSNTVSINTSQGAIDLMVVDDDVAPS